MDRSTIDKVGIVIGCLIAVLPMTWWFRSITIFIATAFFCDLIWHIPKVREIPAALKVFFCLNVFYLVLLSAWGPIREEYLREQRAAIEPSRVAEQAPKAQPEQPPRIQGKEETKSENPRLLMELSSEITNLNLVLDLSKRLKAKDFLGEAFLVRIRSLNLPTRPHIEVLFEVAESWREDREHQWGFMFESFFIEDTTKFVSSHGLLGTSTELGAIPLPLSLVNSTRKPFKKIRDLDQCLIEVFAPSRFARSVSQIRLIANSGFQFTKHANLYSRAVHDSDWEETDYVLSDNFSSKWKRGNDKKYSWLRARTLNGDLQIDVSKSYLVEKGNAMPEILRLQY